MAVSLILHIPHASPEIPWRDEGFFLPHVGYSSWVESVRNAKAQELKAKNEAIQKELIAMTDWYTDELFDHGLGKTIIAPVSRLVCDVERFLHDEDEPMAEKGMGYCYTKGSRNQDLKTFSKEYKDEVLLRYYAPHHVALMDAVETAMYCGGPVLILDCHSFSPVPLPYETDQSPDRPDICIGTDPEHTPKELVDLTVEFFRKRGYKVGVNVPYSGTVFPLRMATRGPYVGSLMIEVNRGLYLKPGTAEKNENFPNVCQHLFDYEMMVSALGR